ncbi:hypothetical protein NKDENANG_00091 [Candidatus Entotheonellaceae bacterium PAL068K]
MSDNVTLIDSTSANVPSALRDGTLIAPIPRMWAIGDLDILEMSLFGFFCSTRYPGNVILRTYDLALALREGGIPIIGGFHSPMEKECLDVLLHGTQAVVSCPACSVERMRLPAAWRKPLAESRLLILSPFAANHRRATAELAEQRNRFVATLTDCIFVAHAAPGSRTEQLCAALVAQGKQLYTLDLAENALLVQHGIVANTIDDLIKTRSRTR